MKDIEMQGSEEIRAEATKKSETITEGIREGVRRRSSRRLRHEAQAQVFVRKRGSLEEIRKTLELRPAQICDLLKVHPSAWIRWTTTGKAPPYVYQMLEWYLELIAWREEKKTRSTTSETAVFDRTTLPSEFRSYDFVKNDLIKEDANNGLTEGPDRALHRFRWIIYMSWAFQILLALAFGFYILRHR